VSKRRAAFEWLIFFIPVIVIATILHDHAPLLLPDQKIEQDRDVWARSRAEALQIISYSADAEFIGQIEWLTE